MIKKYNELNRALIKKLEVLPNVFNFSTEKYGIHEYAAIYGIEKILRRNKVTKLMKSVPNFYLERQHKRLISYAANGQVAEFNYLSQIILKKSIAFRILALNRTMKDWFILPIRNLRRIWNELSFVSRTLSSDLKFKRVWIDKKEGDYARPLGVPTPAWRCYSFMWMDHIEKFHKAAGYLQPWQHGGRSGVGVLSCYKQLIPRLKEENTIYEFDIRGFFDNISHESINKMFKETINSTAAKWISEILEAKPSKYIMPPLEADIGFQAINIHKDKFITDLVPLDYPYFDFPEGDFRVITEAQRIEEGLSDKMELFWPSSLSPYIEDDKIKVQVEMGGDLGSMEDREEISYSENYGDAMRGELRVAPITNPLWQFPVKDFKEADREKGRDAWKSLGQPGRGVPQGLGTSPFISTFLTDTHLYELGTNLKALIMYMDDGIMFAKSKAHMEELIILLKESLGKIGLEIAPEKSKYVKIEGKWQESIKFLGLRYLPESDTFMSDTRSGTKVQFPSKGSWEDVKTMAALNHTNVSNVKQKFDMLINTQAYEAGLKYGFLGCMIAGSQYKDSPTMEVKRQDIERGQNSAWAKVQGSKGFIWKSQDLVNHTEYLTNVSSIACHRFAEFNRLGRKLFIRKGSRSTRRRV